MTKANNHTTRKEFFKKASLAALGLFGLGYTLKKMTAPGPVAGEDGQVMTEKEASEMIRNMGPQKSAGIKPEPPPKKGQAPLGQ